MFIALDWRHNYFCNLYTTYPYRNVVVVLRALFPRRVRDHPRLHDFDLVEGILPSGRPGASFFFRFPIDSHLFHVDCIWNVAERTSVPPLCLFSALKLPTTETKPYHCTVTRPSPSLSLPLTPSNLPLKQDMARNGVAPVVFLDCLRFLSKRSLKNSELFTGEIDKQSIFCLKQSYEQGKRPLRSKKVRATINDAQVANLLLLWLGSLPHPLLPVEHSWHLANNMACRSVDDSDDSSLGEAEGRMKTPNPPGSPKSSGSPLYRTLKELINCTEPFILEVLFPLFELLHHFHLNEEHREESLSYLSTIFTPSIFGTVEDHGLKGAEYDALLRDACATLIKEYRGLFTSHPDLVPEPVPEHVEVVEVVEVHDRLDDMISITFDNIMGDIIAELEDDDLLEASPQKKCKVDRDDSTTSFQFMNQQSPVDFGETGSDSSSPTSVL